MYFRKKMSDDVPEEETAVWVCGKEECKGWMRDNFSFDDVPVCPICSSPMQKSVRKLPVLANLTAEARQKAK
ncbi:cold-shock protein [Saccharibacillus sp. CPCC 101409]|uniref:cold-shock protein n=1 Tax=Saccharibacillus sp. CPCC 101409 TaxID=3058041 RepID=UPI0026716E5B|nr:cold-shock protein [Saccharibacillus sp. CPCC 101409]MDO3410042.1 cold-shock protein [Saccharibacillus sp. CPCC 101409]